MWLKQNLSLLQLKKKKIKTLDSVWNSNSRYREHYKLPDKQQFILSIL